MKRSKKGATLVELCVTLVLVAIFMGMFLSFMVSLRKKTNTNAQQEATMQDIERFEAAIRRWILHYDNCDYDFSVDGNGKLTVTNTLVKAENSTDYIKAHFYYDSAKKQIVGDMYNAVMNENGKAVMNENGVPEVKKVTAITVDVTTISSIQFALEVSASERRLVKCTLGYWLYTDKGEPKYNVVELYFTIHSRSTISTAS